MTSDPNTIASHDRECHHDASSPDDLIDSAQPALAEATQHPEGSRSKAGFHWAARRVESRVRVRQAALELFLKHGFEATTMDDIAALSQVSRRSIYRYFGTKEGIFFSNQHERLEHFKALVAAPEPGETAYETVRRACMVLAESFTEDRDAVLAQYQITDSAHSLMPLEFQMTRQWDDVMAEALGRDGVHDRRTCRAMSGAILGMIRAMLRDWVEAHGEGNLKSEGEHFFDALERGFGLRG